MAHLPQLAAIERDFPLTVSELITLGGWREFGAFRSPGAALKALGEVLDAGQLKRLKQISLQQKGSGVYLEADVKKDLKITRGSGG